MLSQHTQSRVLRRRLFEVCASLMLSLGMTSLLKLVKGAAMQRHRQGVPPVESHVSGSQLVHFWQELLNGDDPGSTTWEVLEYFYARVSRCMGQSPPDVALAEALTAQAMLHIAGHLKS